VNALRGRGELALAAAELKRATELDPGYANAVHNLALVELALGRRQLGLIEIQSFLPDANLTLLGFELVAHVLAKYRARFPERRGDDEFGKLAPVRKGKSLHVRRDVSVLDPETAVTADLLRLSLPAVVTFA